MSPFPDDSTDFADIERRFVRDVVGVRDFEWVAFDRPSPRTPLTVPLSEATVTLVSTAGAHAVGTKPLNAGIPTVSITQVPSITRISKPSLACFVAHPFGLTLGAVGDRPLHETILRRVLETAAQPHPAGSIVPLDHRWPDDLRARQLRKEAH